MAVDISLGIEEQQQRLKSIDLFINYAVVWLLVFSLGIEEQQQWLKSIDLFINYAVVCLFILAWYRRRTTMIKTHRSFTLTSKISYTDLSHKEQPAPLPARKKQLLSNDFQ